jgi:flagellar biosynthesis anti-sigma factor FlgM
MDIRDIQTGPKPSPVPARQVRSGSRNVVGPSSSQDPTPDQVVMSRAARALDEMRQTALASPEVRLARVEHIRQAIAEGTYGPDPDRIAHSLLSQGVLD